MFPMSRLGSATANRISGTVASVLVWPPFDLKKYDALREDARKVLAWEAIEEDDLKLNLVAFQPRSWGRRAADSGFAEKSSAVRDLASRVRIACETEVPSAYGSALFNTYVPPLPPCHRDTGRCCAGRCRF